VAYKFRLALLSVTFCFAALVCAAFADDPDFKPKVQPTPILPDPEANGFKPKFVNDLNALEFQPLIISELYPWVKSGSLQFETASRLKYELNFKRNSEALDKPLGLALSASGSLEALTSYTPGLAFGAYDTFREDSNSHAVGQKIIWNLISHWWSNKLIEADFELLHPIERSADIVFHGNLSRVYPKLLDANDKTIQIFREKIIFNTPSFLSGMSWLTFRFLGADEDVYWVYSPLLKAERELTGSNRADPLAKSSFSPDDIFVWSGKAELVDANFDSEQRRLAIFSSLNQEELYSAGACVGLVRNEHDLEGGHQAWNYQSAKFPNGAAWLPSSAVFVPRDMLRVELVSKDPFSLYGRQVLYVDKESMLPYYKIVFDRAGREWKVAMAVYAQGVTRDKKTEIPIMVSEIVSDVIRDQTFVMDFSKIAVCNSYTETVQLAGFNPNKLGPEQPSPNTASKAAKKTKLK